MNMVRNYVNRGGAVLGIRTASHAFDPRIKPEQSSAFLSGLASWPEFDKEILGGNYQNHSSGKVTNIISIVPGMEGHPILKNVSFEKYVSPESLYWNVPLRSDRAQVILYGTIEGQPSQPVLWTNYTGNNKVIYTSMGAISDWKNDIFRKIMKNSVSYLLNSDLKK